jgi:1A family penicillin-binding protein
MAMASSIRRFMRARHLAAAPADARRAAQAASGRTRKPRRLRQVLLSFMAALILLAGAGYFWLVGDLPSVDGLAARSGFQSSRILDRNGRLLYDLVDPQAGQRTLLPLSAIPQALRDATISTEDANFYQHPGVDAWGLARALWTNLQGGSGGVGGSTITQQLARAVLLSPDEAGQRTLRRKAREAVLAFRIDSRYSKDEILALYLNTIYYGNMAYGVEAAAQAYFGKPARDLDLAECALLAGLPQSPSRYNPLADPDAAKARQREVLDLLVKHGYLTEPQAAVAAAEPLHFAKSRFPIQAPHFVMYVRDLLEAQFGPERVYRGGLTVETTLDADMQAAAETILRRRLADLIDQHVSNGAVVVLDAASGAIRTMVGSADYFDPAIDGEVNLARAPRQPGSSIKPLTYAAALARDYTAATVLPDVPADYPDGNGQTYVPANYDHQFHGPQRLRQALANSYNVPAVYTLNHIGVQGLVEVGRGAGLTTWDDSRRFGLALTLGGGEVRLVDLTGAYAAFANGGRARLPYAITRVRASDGTVLYDAATDAARQEPGVPVFGPHSAAVAWLIGDILADNDARLPAFGANSPLVLSRRAAVKTGTTGDWRDNWTIGYTPDYVTGVWVGNNDNSMMIDSTGVTGAAPIWHDVMERIHQGLPEHWFPRPPDLEQAEVCARSGLLPGPACHDRVREWFIAGTVPTATDTWQQDLAIDNASGLLACPGAAPTGFTMRNFLLLPAEYAVWAAQAGLPAPPTAYAPACDGASAGDSGGLDLALTAPAANAVAGGTITIEGRADGPALAGWSLDWGEGAAPSQWQALATGGPAPGARPLARWASSDRGGVHTLRLQAHLRDGRTLEVRSRLNLDNIAPVAWITYPGPAVSLSALAPGERFPFQAEAQDNTGLAAMLFYGDGRLLGRRDSGPWTLMVDPAALGPGAHHLSVIAVDLAGNRSPPAEVQTAR